MNKKKLSKKDKQAAAKRKVQKKAASKLQGKKNTFGNNTYNGAY